MANKIEQSQEEYQSLSNEKQAIADAVIKSTKKEYTNLIKKYVKVETKSALNEVESNIKKDITDNQIKNTETLAIFVALFTFVSIEFQIFRSFTSWQSAASLSLILLGSLTFFVILIDLLFKKRTIYSVLFLIVPLFLIGLGIYYFQESKIIDSEYILINNELKQTIKDNSKNTKILNCIKDVGWLKPICFNQQD